ncbi:hypothetical protein [Paraburkholderia sp. BCC1886]|uniref:hypothetical protein n=1 Tax=Paraburkholderia sp. BCC1886 TaxID=2562670 RepID=UPI001182C70F|nr:hypothetical protein [Paraburkholderia sp. BCC1886]
MKKIYAIALLLWLGACSTGGALGVGNEKFDPAWIRQHVVTGKTTQQDIQALYGEPEQKQTSASNSDTWIYSKNRSGNNFLSMATGMIPGMSTVNQASSVADIHKKEGYGDTVWFWFKNGVVTNWHN